MEISRDVHVEKASTFAPVGFCIPRKMDSSFCTFFLYLKTPPLGSFGYVRSLFPYIVCLFTGESKREKKMSTFREVLMFAEVGRVDPFEILLLLKEGCMRCNDLMDFESVSSCEDIYISRNRYSPKGIIHITIKEKVVTNN